MSHWKPIEYILIVEKRICTTCRATYLAPSPTTRVLIQSGTSSRTISIDEFAERLSMEHTYVAFLPTLPRSIREVSLPINSCPQCFHEFSELQIDFWPRPAPLSLSVPAIEASRRRTATEMAEAAIKPATLEDIP